MDGLELNLFKSDNKKIKIKKKTTSKSKKLFLKKKFNKNGSKTVKPFRKKADKPLKQEINQNKEISTIQDEFSSGLDEIKKSLDKSIKKKNDLSFIKKNHRPKLDQIKEKSGDKEIKSDNDQLKNDLKQFNKDNELIKNDKLIKKNYKQDSISKTNLEISMINDEFSDGLIDLNSFKTDESNKNSKRKFSNEDGNFIRSEKKLNRNKSPSNRHQFNNSDNFSHKLSSDDLKNDFNKLFASKGKNEKLDSHKFENSKFNSKSNRSNFTKNSKYRDEAEEKNYKNDSKGFISNLFRSNPEIPEIHLKNLKDENKEDVFDKIESSFESLKDRIHPHLVACLSSKLNINKMTNVQCKSIPLILDKHDLMVKSVTGSGKTFVYIIPIIQILQAKTPKINRTDGIHALIIVPTRELVNQCYIILENLCKAFTFIVPGYLMGGENKHSEKNRIRKGINILVSTPGRLLDHIATTKNLTLNKIEILVIDEADRMYEAGFEESIKNIVTFINDQKEVPKDNLQTILLSATLTTGVKSLAGIALRNPILIDTFEEEEQTSKQAIKFTFPKNLKQYFCLVPAKLRLLTLASFIVKNCSFEKSSKILIFVSTQGIVDFHYNLFKTTFNRIIKNNDLDEIDFFKLHGNMEQKDRMKIFQQFKETKTGVLISTDVAARGLDLKEIEFVVQYTCPSSIEDYVHRIGRTARIEHNGCSLIFLLPSEINFLKYIQKELEANLDEIRSEDILKILSLLNFGKSNKVDFREHASQLQFEFESATHADEDGKLQLARKAYLSFVRAYATYPRLTKSILPFKELHLGHLCKSFCLRDAPRTLSGFKQQFISKVNKPEAEKFSRKFERNKNILNKRIVPMEKKFSEFDSGF